MLCRIATSRLSLTRAIRNPLATWSYDFDHEIENNDQEKSRDCIQSVPQKPDVLKIINDSIAKHTNINCKHNNNIILFKWLYHLNFW